MNIKALANTAVDWFGIIIAFSVLIVFLAFLSWALQPLSPIVTLLVSSALTMFTFERKTTTALAVIGIILFIASWPALYKYGVAISLTIWSAGILTWFGAVYYSIKNRV